MSMSHFKAEIQSDKIIAALQGHLKALEASKAWPEDIIHSHETILTLANILKSLQQIHKRFLVDDLEVAEARKIYKIGKKVADTLVKLQQVYFDIFKDKFYDSQKCELQWSRYLAYFYATYFEFETYDEDKFVERSKRIQELIDEPYLAIKSGKVWVSDELDENLENAALYYDFEIQALEAYIKFNSAAILIHLQLDPRQQNEANLKATEYIAQAQSIFSSQLAHGPKKQCDALLQMIDALAKSRVAEDRANVSSSSTALILTSKVASAAAELPLKTRVKYETQIVEELFTIGKYPRPDFRCDYSKITHYLGVDFDKTLFDMDGKLLHPDKIVECIKKRMDYCLLDVITTRPDDILHRNYVIRKLRQIELEHFDGRVVFRRVYFANNNSKEFVIENVHNVDLPHLPISQFGMLDDQLGILYQCQRKQIQVFHVDENAPRPRRFPGEALDKFFGDSSPIQQLTPISTPLIAPTIARPVTPPL